MGAGHWLMSGDFISLNIHGDNLFLLTVMMEFDGNAKTRSWVLSIRNICVLEIGRDCNIYGFVQKIGLYGNAHLAIDLAMFAKW